MKKYEYLWRNKFLTIDAESIDDMIDILEGSVNQLKEMRDAGVILSHGQEDDYATLVTESKEVAEKFDFQEPFDEEEEEFIDDEDEDDEEDDHWASPNPF